MPKSGPEGQLQLWQEAESRYVALVTALDHDTLHREEKKARKAAILEVEEARAKADKHRAKYFRKALS